MAFRRSSQFRPLDKHLRAEPNSVADQELVSLIRGRGLDFQPRTENGLSVLVLVPQRHVPEMEPNEGRLLSERK